MWKKFLTSLLFVCPTLLYAADATNPNWQFDIAPYLWALNMDGTVINGPFTSNISENFSQIMQQFDAGGMLWLSANKGPFGLYFNGLYTVLDDHGNVGRFDANMKTRFGIMAAGISYIVYQHQFANTYADDTSQLQLTPYLGTRYTFNHVHLNIASLSIQSNHHWNDPLIGLRVKYDVTRRWLLDLMGDVGGTSTTNQYSLNLTGLIGYKPSTYMKNTTWYAGYRYLYQHYETGSGLTYFNWRMALFGPVVGVDISF